MAKKNPVTQWFINLTILFIIILIAFLTNFILEKSVAGALNAANDAINDLAEADSFTGQRVIEGMEPKKNEKLEVINHYMAGSYNSCFIKKLNHASLDALKLVLSKGIRCLDFEVFLTKNSSPDGPPNLAVVGSEMKKFDKKKAIENCKTKKAIDSGNRTQDPQVTLKQVFDIIATDGYIGRTSNYPIFINLRIKTPKPEVYTVLANDLKSSMLNKKILDPQKYGKCGKFIRQLDQNIIYQELLGDKLKGKVIIMVEDWCKNYENSDFYSYIHFAAGNNLNSKTDADISTKAIPLDEQKTTFSLVKPDDYFQGTKEMTQPSLFNSKSNGINILYWNYLCKECVNPTSKVANLGNKTDLENDVKKTGFRGFFESNVFIPKPEEKRWKLELAISKEIQPKGLACAGTGVCQYMGEDPTGTKSENPTFNIAGCEKTAKIIYDGRSCINGKDVIWKKKD